MSYENQADFMRDITPHAQRVGAQLGIDPRLIIAQAIQETGWGKKVKGNNFDFNKTNPLDFLQEEDFLRMELTIFL